MPSGSAILASRDARLAGVDPSAPVEVVRPEEIESGLAAQVQDHAQQLPELEALLRSAQLDATGQRAEVTLVQQKIQVLAAEQRSVEEQSRQI